MAGNQAARDKFPPLPAGVESAPDGPEKEVLALWRDEKTFETVLAARSGAPAFVFWEGPPTANGRPGIHHVLARTIKDAVCRFRTMQGRRVERKAGWDTHGLPVELEVEKSLGISGKPQIEQYGVAQFNAKCRESVWTYRKEWEQLSERTGYWLDYDHPYVTYEGEYVESVWYLLKLFHDRGLVYRGKRVLPYCGRCGTGLSAHELGQPGVYRDVMDPSITVRFRLHDSTAGEPESVLAWTTTPWTLPSNVALAVHPAREYVLARIPLPVAKSAQQGSSGYERVWVARERAMAILGKENSDFEVVTTAIGAGLVGRTYEGLYDANARIAPGAWIPRQRWIVYQRGIVAADYVTVEEGTGIVHQAPSYGVDDWETARAHRLPVLQLVGPEGKFVEDVCAAEGSSAVVMKGTLFKAADDALIEDLKSRGLLFRKAHESHSYPHCWRCSTPLFYFAVPAWYIRTTAVKNDMVALNDRVHWVPPEVGEKRFGEWLKNNVDWNISRDRYWGTPLPFWVCEGCDAEVAIGGLAELKRRGGVLPDGFDWHKPSIDEVTLRCEKCGGVMSRTKSVLDCWFDSGAMPYAQLGWPHKPGSSEKLRDQFPADFIAEGLDQTRGWFYTLHAIGTFVTSLPELGVPDGPPYRACAVNGLLLDKEGVKMSKRLGNVVDPWKTVQEHGADALRWYLLASGQPWLPKRFDPSGVLEVRRKFLGTLVNSYKFFAEYARIDAFEPADPRIPPPRERSGIDRWLISRTQSLIAEVSGDMDVYDLPGACRALETFVLDDLSNWYIRRNRRRFWKSETGKDKLAAYATLHSALCAVALLSAPVLPFLTELLWRRLSPRKGSVHAELLPTSDGRLVDTALEASMRTVTRVVELGRALRERTGLKVRQPLREIHIRTSDLEALRLLATPFARDLVLGELNIKAIGSLGVDDGALCRLKAKANFRTLGKRLGPRMKAAAAAIDALSNESLTLLRAGRPTGVDVDGERVELQPDDVHVTVETQPGHDVETDGRYVVSLDTRLDEGLVVEGLAREVINRVNGMRKDSGLAVDDRVRVLVSAVEGDDLRKALSVHSDLIRAETLAVELAFLAQDAACGSIARRGFDLGEGRRLEVGLARA